MPIAIETNELSRIFQSYQKPEGVMNSLKGFWNRQYNNKIALAPTTLQIEAGQIVGLVGSNGAGKTTLLKLLSGLITSKLWRCKCYRISPLGKRLSLSKTD